VAIMKRPRGRPKITVGELTDIIAFKAQRSLAGRLWALVNSDKKISRGAHCRAALEAYLKQKGF
jgi:hypothetical protein